jgi:prepilin-type N-terminal cleavage/methylation domain-containing protein
MQKQKGFSLIELLIVVAIILIIASIAIPNLLATRRQAHEAAAAEAIRTINTAQISYNSVYPLATAVSVRCSEEESIQQSAVSASGMSG